MLPFEPARDEHRKRLRVPLKAKEISMDAAAAAASSDLGDILPLE